MGFLRRFRGDDEVAVPDWADVFDGPTYNSFIDAVTKDLTRRGFKVRIDDGYAVVDHGTEEPYKFGLTNLVQVCHQIDRRDWPATIAEHFSGLLTDIGRDLDALAADYAQVAPILRVRLMPDASAGLDLPGSVTRPVAQGVQAVLVYDFPDSTANVHADHPALWPVGVDGAFEQAMANQVEPLGTPTRRDNAEIELSLYLGDNFYVATWALRLDEVLPPGTTDAFVAVPTRHSLVVHPIVDKRAIQSLSAIYKVALTVARQGPGTISDQPYWWHEGSFTLVPHSFDGDKIVVVPPDGLLAVFERVVG
jgi:hypothetical protein